MGNMATRIGASESIKMRSLITAAAVLVALVTIHAVIDITLHAGVVRIRLGFQVAIRALEHGIVVRVRVAA